MRDVVPVSGTRDERIGQIAAHQRSRVDRRQLRQAGISDSAITRLVAKGQLHREHPGVFAVGHPGHGPLTRETSALLACRPGALLSHMSAAELWGLVRPGHPGRPVDVLIAGRQTARPAGVTVHRTRRLHPSEVRFHERLPVTSPARTIFEIADELPKRAVERAIDDGLERNLVRLSQIRDVIARNPGRRASTILRSLLQQRTGSTVSRSDAEERALWLLREANLPQPEMNFPLHGYTADFYWPQYRLVLEVDGYRYHSSKTAFERDRRKDAVFRAAALDVIRVSSDQVFDEAYAVIALVAMAIARAQARVAA